MASERKRGCGYRQVNGLYLVGEYIGIPCDRLPLELRGCPVCGAGIHFTRAMTEINPLKLFGNHDDGYIPDNVNVLPSDNPEPQINHCLDKIRPCKVCDPPNAPAFIMTVGKRYYTPQSFMQEAMEMGVSKRIPFIPKHLKLSETIVYLAHPEAFNGIQRPIEQAEQLEFAKNKQARLIDADKVVKGLGIFCAFIPQRIEMPIYKSKLTKKKKAELGKRGITPVIIKDGDKDHQ